MIDFRIYYHDIFEMETQENMIIIRTFFQLIIIICRSMWWKRLQIITSV